MKKVFLPLLAAAAVLCGCQANESLDVKTPSGKKMTLTASIPSSQTKVVYSEEMTNAGLSLKATWSDKDTISVVLFESDGSLMSVEDFVCEGAAGQTKAVFTGTFSYEDPAYAIAVYPRLEYDDDYECYINKAETVFAGDGGFSLYCWDEISEEPSEMERLAQAAVILGKVNMVDDDYSLVVELQHQFSLLKVNIQLPEVYAGMHINDYEVSLYTYSEAENDYVESEIFSWAEYIPRMDKTFFYSDDNYPESTILHYNMNDQDCSHVVDENGVLSAYIMVFPTQLNKDDMFYISVELEKAEGQVFGDMAECLAGPVGRDTMLEAGKLYTISCEGEVW